MLDKRTVTEYDSAAWQAGDEQALFGPIAGGHVSLPVFGKHLVFDGTPLSHASLISLGSRCVCPQ